MSLARLSSPRPPTTVRTAFEPFRPATDRWRRGFFDRPPPQPQLRRAGELVDIERCSARLVSALRVSRTDIDRSRRPSTPPQSSAVETPTDIRQALPVPRPRSSEHIFEASRLSAPADRPHRAATQIWSPAPTVAHVLRASVSPSVSRHPNHHIAFSCAVAVSGRLSECAPLALKPPSSRRTADHVDALRSPLDLVLAGAARDFVELQMHGAGDDVEQEARPSRCSPTGSRW